MGNSSGPRESGFCRRGVLGIAISFGLLGNRANADTTAEWLNTGGGGWTTATNWSTNPYFPNNNSPHGVKYQALIDQDGMGDYQVNLSSNIAVDGLTMTTANATLDQTAGTLTVTTLDMTAGEIVMNGGTIAANASGSAMTVASGASFQVMAGTLSGMTINSGSDVGIANSGSLTFSGTNDGTISGSTATLNLAGSFSLASLGTFNFTNSVVNLNGNLALNPSDVLSLGSASGNWNLNNGSITGGTIAGTAAQTFNITGGTLNGVTCSGIRVSGTSTLSQLIVTNGITGSGQNLNFTGNLQTLQFIDASEQISDLNITNANQLGTGFTTVAVGPTSANTSATLTLGSDAGIQATTGRIELQGATAGPAMVVNNGTIGATGSAGKIEVLTAFTNGGAISANSNGTFDVENGSFYNNSAISANGGILTFNGYYLGNNAGGSITVTNQSQLTLENSWTNYGKITVDDSTATLSGTWANVPGASITVQNGGVLNIVTSEVNAGTFHLAGGTINLPPGIRLRMGSGTLSGSGTISGEVDFTQFTGGTLAFDVGGAMQGSGYDSLTITGSLLLSSDYLNITLTNGFASSITPGEQFIVADAEEGLGGSFSNVANGGRLITTDGFGSFQVNYGSGIYADEIVLNNFQAIPEPTSLGMVGPGLILLGRRRRKV